MPAWCSGLSCNPVTVATRVQIPQPAFMRMWMVEPHLMCNNHLLGEHNELHMLLGTIENHPHGDEVLEGLAEKEMVDLSSLEGRHGELVGEMEKRGMNHQSPLVPVPEKLPDFGGSVNPEENKEELSGKCRSCRKRIQGRNI